MRIKIPVGVPGTTAVFEADGSTFLEDESLSHEIFGPGTTLVRWTDKSELINLLESFVGQLTERFTLLMKIFLNTAKSFRF